MHIPRFYQNQTLTCGHKVTLDSRASHHLCVVLRARQGEPCLVFNGDGKEYLAEVLVPHRKHTEILLREMRAPKTESSLQIHWAQCLSASERMDYTIQKATELGVAEITPLISERMSVKWRPEKAEKKLQHWQKIAVSASEQSLRVKVPKINSPKNIDDFMVDRTHERAFILDTNAQENIFSQKTPKDDILFIAGSESGLSQAELHHASQAGFTRIGFGPRVLRTETVASAVLAVVQHLWGDI